MKVYLLFGEFWRELFCLNERNAETALSPGLGSGRYRWVRGLREALGIIVMVGIDVCCDVEGGCACNA